MISKRKILLLQHNNNDTNLISLLYVYDYVPKRYLAKEKNGSVTK